MSPELVDGRYNTKSDIWSLGCLIYELCTLQPPFQAITQSDLAQKIKSGKTANLPSNYSSELQKVVHWMFTVEHSKRPTSSQFLQYDRIKLAIKEQELTNR